jgi:inosine-uridine nucleoside N-ribohydrolase
VTEKVRVLLDTDANNEIDDQHAIAYLLLSGDAFVVEGLTVNRTDNGGDIEEQAKEAERVVKLCTMHPQLPVTRGASGSFEEITPHLTEPDFDGADAVNLIIARAHSASLQKLVLLPIGKLTNVALALKKDPTIVDKVKVVWLGSNYPEPGEYNLENDTESLNFVLETNVEFEMAVVRYGAASGTSAVRVTRQDVAQNLAGKGPRAAASVTGRNGGKFMYFGDYSINLIEHIDLYGDPPSRALYDMAAVAIVKNPSWAEARVIAAPILEGGSWRERPGNPLIAAPILEGGSWRERPGNPRKIVIRENFDKQAIVDDFYATMNDYQLADIVT